MSRKLQLKRLSARDKKIIQLLQSGLPINAQPYKQLARKIGISEQALLKKLSQWKAQGLIRRFGAIVHHYKIGKKANALCFWQVTEQELYQAGKIVSSYPEVSHCYERQRYLHWPYNVYAMMHCRTKKQCKELARQISQRINAADCLVLFTLQELKKTAPTYF